MQKIKCGKLHPIVEKRSSAGKVAGAIVVSTIDKVKPVNNL